MAGLWPWLAVAGAGALHGLNPATGWAFAAAWGVRSHDRTQALRALVPIAVGHAASVALVAGALAASVQTAVTVEPWVLQAVAGVLLAAVGLHCRAARGAMRKSAVPARHAGLALWSFIMATAQGAGLMLVPALVPLCVGEGPAREISASGSAALVVAAAGVHMAAMLAVSGVMACGACGLIRPRLP